MPRYVAKSLGQNLSLADLQCCGKYADSLASLKFLTARRPRDRGGSTKAFTTQLAALFLLTLVALLSCAGRLFGGAGKAASAKRLRHLPSLLQAGSDARAGSNEVGQNAFSGKSMRFFSRSGMH